MQILHNTLIFFVEVPVANTFFVFLFFISFCMSCVFNHFLGFFQGKFWGCLYNRVATLVTIGEQQIKQKIDFEITIFTDSDYSRPNSFRLRLRRPGNGSSV